MNAGSEAVRSNGPPQSPRTVGRKRRVAGWTLVMAGVIVAALWVASGWWSFQRFWVSPDGDMTVLAIERARVGWASGIVNNRGFPQYERVIYARERIIGGMPSWEFYPEIRHSHGSLPLWPFLVFLWTPAALLLRSGILARRRANTNACAKCGYSLAGLAADAPCPECGKGAGTK